MALYGKKNKGQKIDKKMYTVVTIVIILMVETKEYINKSLFTDHNNSNNDIDEKEKVYFYTINID